MNGDTQAGGVTVTDNMMASMRSIKPWTKLMAILGFASVGLMVLFSVVFMVFANTFPQQKNAPSPYIGFMYIVFAILYFFPAFYLYKYSASIGAFLKSNGSIDLESALSYQKSFWKFVGIAALVGMILGVLAIAAAVIIPILTKARV